MYPAYPACLTQQKGHIIIYNEPAISSKHILQASATAAQIESYSEKVKKIFEIEAKAIIHYYSGGVPRQINNIATACLINAAAKNRKTVDETLVNQPARREINGELCLKYR